MADLFPIAEARGPKSANVVFVHGLGGDVKRTWQATKDQASFWPAWLAQDIESLSVYSLGYEATVSRWRGSAMDLPGRAANVLDRLLAEPALANGSLILVSHSLGGLVIKQLLREAESNARRREDAADFLRRVEKIAFLATPHSGAGLATLGDRLRILVRPSAATACLVHNDPNLRDLNLWYRGWANQQHIAHLIPSRVFPRQSPTPARRLLQAALRSQSCFSASNSKSRLIEGFPSSLKRDSSWLVILVNGGEKLCQMAA